MTPIQLHTSQVSPETAPEAAVARMGAQAGAAVASVATNALDQAKQVFRAMLAKAQGKPTEKEIDAAKKKEAEDAAAGLVSAALILPVLKQVRRSPWGENGPFSPGTGEKAFGPQFDMQLADRIAHSPRLGIKNALAQRMLQRGKPIVRLVKPVELKGLDLHG